MNVFIRKNPFRYSLIVFLTCLLITLIVARFYIDYRVNCKIKALETKLDGIEDKQDIVLNILSKR